MSIGSGRRRTALAATGVAVALIVAGCGQSGGGATGGATGTASDSAGVAHAEQQIAKYSQVVDAYVPTEKLTNPAALKSKKIMYIPAVAAIPFFVTSWKALKAAFTAAGVQADICDAQANPATMSACLDQATNGGYSGIIVDSISPTIAQQSYQKALDAKIPVVLGTLPLPDGSPSTVVTVGPQPNLPVQLAADAIIVATKGKANVVGVEITDSDSTKSRYEGGLQEFKTYCPGCQVTTVETKSPDMQQLPSKVSAAILAHPGVNYLMPEFSNVADATIQGAVDAGKGSLPVSTAATTLGDLQNLAAKKTVSTTVGWDVVHTMWNEADVLIRLMIGQKVDATQYLSPVRVFNAGNVGSLQVSQAGWDSSNWFGGLDYQAKYRALWQ
jgi:ribose transport system substrate-binding protein